MANFYKSGGSYYNADTNQKILNTAELQSFAKAGGKEITAPTPKAGSVAISDPTAIKNFNITNQIGDTLYGTPKTPTSSDIEAGLNAGGVKPPQGTADLIHQTFANNASQYSQAQKDLIAIRESQLAETEKQMNDTNTKIAENEAKIKQNTTDIKNAETGSMDDPNLQGWRQSALGITSEDLKTKYEDYKTEYSSRKSMGDELATLATMYANELAKPQPVAIASVATGRLNNTKEQYVGRISALQAGISAIDGNISMAQTFIDRGIETVNSDRQDRLSYLNFIQGLATTEKTDLKNKLLTLTKDEQTAIDNEIKIIQDKITETENNKKFMQTLFTDTQTAQTAIKSGVNLTDTPDQAVKKMSDYIKAHPNEFDSGKVTFGIIGQDDNGNNIYGFIDTGTKTVTGNQSNKPNNSSGGIVKTSTGDAYDIGSYATDPNHEASIQSILNNIGQFKSVSDIDAYIKKIAPSSPITGAMVKSAADKYGVSWEMMVAIMQQDSNLGTAGKGARTYNPGNVGNTDSGVEVNYKTWQAGVDAVAKNLAGRKAENNTSSQAETIAQTIFAGTGSLSGVSTKNNLRSKVAIELEKLKATAISEGNVEGMMRASAGGQNMSDTAVTSLEKAVNVVGQLEELQKAVDKEATGPIWGTIRSNNPYDVKAQAIKAQLTAIVPNLARGIYGEVGVLTDNDVALYAKTLPNLKSTEEVSNLVLAATVRSVQRSIENKMLIQAGANRDVSGLVNEYLKVKNKADEMESRLQSGNNNLNNTNTSNSTSMIENQKGFWSKVGNWLWGN